MGCCFYRRNLSSSDLNFLLENTDFTRNQIIQWHKDFLVDCPKGTLSKENFLKAYKQFFPEGEADNFCDHIFRAFDIDHSGHIDFKEFLMAINITSKGDPKSKLTWAFRMYDIDGNNQIDLEEMKKIVQSICDLTGSHGEYDANCRAKKIFDIMDEDKDGVITQDEFIRGCMQDELLYNKLVEDVSA